MLTYKKKKLKNTHVLKMQWLILLGQSVLVKLKTRAS
jgi:hypothetical protein